MRNSALACTCLLVYTAAVQAGDPWRGRWIWDSTQAAVQSPLPAARYFRKTVTLEAGINQNHTLVLADNRFKLHVNGNEVLAGSGWSAPTQGDLTAHLRAGVNILAIEAVNESGPAGLYFESTCKNARGELIHVVSDASWRVSAHADPGWTRADFDDSRWKAAAVLGPVGIAPWGKLKKPGSAPEQPASEDPLPAAESLERFTAPPGFQVRLVAEEPDVINPVAVAMDAQGRLFVAESHTYRWGREGTPVSPPTNPIVMLEIGTDGRARRKTIVAQGYEDPVMGLAIRGGRIWIAALNQLLVADIHPDGTAGPQKLLVRDVAKPWNPFGFYRIAFGPDGWLYLIVGDHEIELIDADGRHVKTRGPTGALFRCRPDGTGLELLTQGMRAPFSFDFDPYGHTWILSNGEGNPNRLLMMIPGADYHFQTRHGDWAWLAGTHTWSPPVTEMERGANTQVLCYLDGAYPRQYWGALFVANWGAHGFASINHKIDVYTPDARGRITDVSVFLESTDPRFRPTQLLPDDDGNLLMMDWYGKDDENDLTGRIYRIIYQDGGTARQIAGSRSADTDARLTGEALEKLWSPHSRTRAAAGEALSRSPVTPAALAARIKQLEDPFARAQILWALWRMGTPEAIEAIAGALADRDPSIRALCVRLLREFNPPDLKAKLQTLASNEDPEVRVEAGLCERGQARAIVCAMLDALDAGAVDDRRLRYQCAVELSRWMRPDQFVALARDPSPARALIGWIALDVALLEKTNPAADTAFSTLLEQPADHAPAVLELAQRWAGPGHVHALQAFLSHEVGSGGTPERIAAAFNVLRRFGPDALAGVPAGAVNAFFENALAGTIQLPRPADRIAALKLLETAESGDATLRFVQSALADADVSVRLQALRTVRVIGWQHPELFTAVWQRMRSDLAMNRNERLTALVTLGSEEKPEPGRWKALIESDDLVISRGALRACKQFAGNTEIRDMLLQTVFGLLERRPGLQSELAAVWALFDLDAGSGAKLELAPLLTGVNPRELQRQMLERLADSNPRLGADVFERAGCAACHDVSGQTESFGPALRDIGKAATPASLAESILLPSQTIKDGFEMQFVRTKDGRELEGWVESHGAELIVVRGGTERIRLAAHEVLERRKLNASPMPEMSLDGVSIDELADLLGYLVSQGGRIDAAGASRPAATAPAAQRPAKSASARQ